MSPLTRREYWKVVIWTIFHPRNAVERYEVALNVIHELSPSLLPLKKRVVNP